MRLDDIVEPSTLGYIAAFSNYQQLSADYLEQPYPVRIVGRFAFHKSQVL